MEAQIDPFKPSAGATRSLAATTTSGTTRTTIAVVGSSYRVYNDGAVPVFLEWGTNANSNTPTATIGTASTSGSMPIAPGVTESITIPTNGLTLLFAGITASGTATLWITPGVGA
jgi:hypothetical protein